MSSAPEEQLGKNGRRVSSAPTIEINFQRQCRVTQFNVKLFTIKTKHYIDAAIRNKEGNRDETHHAKLSCLHTTKLKAEASLQEDSWLYNEIMVLKKKIVVIQKELDHEHVMRAHLEKFVGNIPDKLNNYELEICQIIKESGQRME